MSVINHDTRATWQQIANTVSRQRPSQGRRVHVFRGRNLRGRVGTVVRHQRDRWSDAFRYGGEANLHLREMTGRDGYACLVRTDDGIEKWVKAQNLVCEYAYGHWTEALADAVSIGLGRVAAACAEAA